MEVLKEEKCAESVFEGKESSRVSDVLREVVPDERTKVGQGGKTLSFVVEASEFEHARV